MLATQKSGVVINGHYEINRMGFGKQQRLNAVDTDKYSHFGAKCTYIGTQHVKARLREKLAIDRVAGHFNVSTI